MRRLTISERVGKNPDRTWWNFEEPYIYKTYNLKIDDEGYVCLVEKV